MNVLGIDVGGSAIKGAVVDTATGRLLTPVERMANDRQVSPQALVEATISLTQRLRWEGMVGVGFPGLLRGGRVREALNLHPGFRGSNLQSSLREAMTDKLSLLNDADAAGLAEVAFGAGKGAIGSVLILTFGTGIGSALVVNQRLCPNTEFGLLPIGRQVAQDSVSAAAKIRRRMDYPVWADEVNGFLRALENVVNPDLIIIGGGISAEHEQWFKFLRLETAIVPAFLRNDAGIVGAALFAAQEHGSRREKAEK